MTYRELKEILNSMTETELNQTVTAYLNLEDEFTPISSVLISDSSEDRLDQGHVYFSV